MGTRSCRYSQQMIQERGKGVCASDKYQIEDQGEQKFSSIGS